MKRLGAACLFCINWTWRLLVLVVLFFNLRLYAPSPLVGREGVPPHLISQLAANRSAIEAGCPEQMQQLFPEGYYFSYLFHGLTWIELGIRDESLAPQAVEEARWCLSRLNSPKGREPFPAKLPPDHGMFYSAWKCSLRAGVVLLQESRDQYQLKELRKECDAIAQALRNSETPFLASYTGTAWPCDTVPAIHALRAYDQITNEQRYKTDIGTWLIAARERLDNETQLLPHIASLPDGREASSARATSQVIMLRFLPDIDSEFAKQQYQLFRERFLLPFAGAPSVLEYPTGVHGVGDVDSGPLIFGRSLSATVMMIGVAQVYGDQELADAIAQAGETVGLPWTSDNEKRYAAGVMPIGDIMVAYSHVAKPWFADREHLPDSAYRVSRFWRWKIHALSAIVLLPLLPTLIRILRKTNEPEPTPATAIHNA